MIKVKVCGITRDEDATAIINAGAYAIGFIFYQKSPRFIETRKAKILSNKFHSANIKVIGVFVNEDEKIINDISNTVNLDFIQLHGYELKDCIKRLNRPVIKNIRNISDIDKYKNAEIFLVDSSDNIAFGGTGKLADWNFAKKIKELNKPLMLSGGLNINNIEEVINCVNPDYIDISSGLEKKVGIKDFSLIKNFFDKLKDMEKKYEHLSR